METPSVWPHQRHQISGPSSFWITATLYPWGFSKMCLRPAPKNGDLMATNNPTIKPLDKLNWNGDPMWSTWCSKRRKAWPQQCCLSSSQHASEDGHWNASLGRLKRWKLSKLKHHWGCISVWSLTATKPKKLCKLRIASPTHSWPECFKTLHINQFRKYNRFCQQESLPGKERTGWDSHWKLPFHIVGLHKVLNENDMDLFLRVK